MNVAEAIISQTDIEVRLNPATLIALADDDGDGAADSVVIGEICLDASEEAKGWVATEYRDLFPFTGSASIPRMLKQTAVYYAIAALFDKHPEYVRQYGENDRADGLRQRAEKLGQQLREATKRFGDNAKVPANIGGSVSSVVGSRDFPNAPPFVFADTGDF